MPEQKPRTIPLRERRRLLRSFRKQYGITLTELGKRVGLTNPMLSQFENGKRDLSAGAWARVLLAMETLLSEDEQRRKAERAKASETAAKLGVVSVSSVEEKAAQEFSRLITSAFNNLTAEGSKEIQEIQAKGLNNLQQLWRMLEKAEDTEELRAVKKERDQLRARVAELEADLARERANKAGGISTITPDMPERELDG